MVFAMVRIPTPRQWDWESQSDLGWVGGRIENPQSHVGWVGRRIENPGGGSLRGLQPPQSPTLGGWKSAWVATPASLDL
jgi:hypothetical protein